MKINHFLNASESWFWQKTELEWIRSKLKNLNLLFCFDHFEVKKINDENDQWCLYLSIFYLRIIIIFKFSLFMNKNNKIYKILEMELK